MASLSLALGLTDAVTSRNGGIQLDSLFIDEGFGTLDSETQEKAMETLNELQENKMVGIISHIELLKTSIRSQIKVEKQQLVLKFTLIIRKYLFKVCLNVYFLLLECKGNLSVY